MIQNPNLKMKLIVLNRINPTNMITAIALKLSTEIPNIKITKTESRNAPSSNILDP